MADDIERVETWSEKNKKALSQSPRRRFIKGALKVGAALGLATIIAKSPIGDAAEEVTRGVTDAFNNAVTDQYKPEASQVQMGGRLIIDFTQGPAHEVFPHIRLNPIIHNPQKDGQYNGINLDEIASINNIAVDLNPGTRIEINNYTTVQGEDADSNSVGAKDYWAVEELTMKDGSEILGYISLSDKTAGNITTNGGAIEPLAPNTPTPDLNITTVVKP